MAPGYVFMVAPIIMLMTRSCYSYCIGWRLCSCIYGGAYKQGDDEGVFISRVTPGGPADLAGLRVHDKVLSVNGISCVNVDHYEAVGILKVPFFTGFWSTVFICWIYLLSVNSSRPSPVFR